MNLDMIMESPRLKVKRADKHINALIKDATIIPRDLYSFELTQIRTIAPLSQPNQSKVEFKANESIRKHFGAFLGDAVNNLRESLDVWIRNASEAVGPRRGLYFPFSKERSYLEASGNYKSVEKVFPDAARFIRDHIEPCKDRNLYLWAVTDLCGDNKHDDFLPVATITTVHNIKFRFGGNTFQFGGFNRNSDNPGLFALLPLGATLENDFHVSGEISFPDGAVFENQAVIPTLLKMSEVVSSTLDALEAFIAPYCD